MAQSSVQRGSLLGAPRHRLVDVLTRREHAIAAFAATGLSNKEIGRQLGLTEGTVKAHLHNIYQKARISSRTALVALMNGSTLRQPG
jgi:DNA-binding NarL/FixJ family response regulator